MVKVKASSSFMEHKILRKCRTTKCRKIERQLEACLEISYTGVSCDIPRIFFCIFPKIITISSFICGDRKCLLAKAYQGIYQNAQKRRQIGKRSMETERDAQTKKTFK